MPLIKVDTETLSAINTDHVVMVNNERDSLHSRWVTRVVLVGNATYNVYSPNEEMANKLFESIINRVTSPA